MEKVKKGSKSATHSINDSDKKYNFKIKRVMSNSSSAQASQTKKC